VLGVDEFGELTSQLVVVFIVETFHVGAIYGAVHWLDLVILQRLFNLGQSVAGLMLTVDVVEDVFEGIDMPVVIGELDAIIYEHVVDHVGCCSDEVVRKCRGIHFPGRLVQFHESELGSAIDREEQVELAFSSLKAALNRGNHRAALAYAARTRR
jgi:hypothetical protein